jgi:hypothetical protein
LSSESPATAVATTTKVAIYSTVLILARFIAKQLIITRAMRTIGAREPDSTAHPIDAEHPLISKAFCFRFEESRKQYKHKTKLNTANSDMPEM